MLFKKIDLLDKLKNGESVASVARAARTNQVYDKLRTVKQRYMIVLSKVPQPLQRTILQYRILNWMKLKKI